MSIYSEMINKIPSSIYKTEAGSNVNKLFQLYCKSFEDLNKHIEELSQLRNISNQTSSGNTAVLDAIGEIVKEPRNFRNNNEYEKFLRVAIARNSANGSLSSMVNIIKMISDATPGNSYLIRELFNSIVLQFLDPKSDLVTLEPTCFLDGTEYLNATTDLPAALQVTLTGMTDKEKDYLDEAIEQIKPAGIEIEYN